MSMPFGVIVAAVVRVTAGRNHRRSAVVTAGLFSFAAGGEGNADTIANVNVSRTIKNFLFIPSSP